MNPISLAMDGLLAVLLLTAVAVGVRLNGKLRLLRDSQGQFVKAVGDLDAAAGRAESGLQALRSATEEAHDALLSRIETARGLVPKLDRAAEEAASASARLDAGVQAADAAGRRAHAAAETAARAAAELSAAVQAAAARGGAVRAAAPHAEPEPLTDVGRAPARIVTPPSRFVGEPIPFPSPAREPAARGLEAALRAAERIVEAEAGEGPAGPGLSPERERVAAPLRAAAFAPEPATGAAGDRLARFVARRRSARG